MVYVQSNSEKTLPHHFDAACGLYGAMDNALDYCLVTFEEVSGGKFDNLIKKICLLVPLNLCVRYSSVLV